MATTHDASVPAYDCPHCSGSFERDRLFGHCSDCGYVPGHGAD
jgi:hypothetical protein